MVEQPLVLEHKDNQITLSGLKQLMQELTPEQIKQLEKDLQEVVNLACTQYIGPIPSE